MSKAPLSESPPPSSEHGSAFQTLEKNLYEVITCFFAAVEGPLVAERAEVETGFGPWLIPHTETGSRHGGLGSSFSCSHHLWSCSPNQTTSSTPKDSLASPLRPNFQKPSTPNEPNMPAAHQPTRWGRLPSKRIYTPTTNSQLSPHRSKAFFAHLLSSQSHSPKPKPFHSFTPNPNHSFRNARLHTPFCCHCPFLPPRCLQRSRHHPRHLGYSFRCLHHHLHYQGRYHPENNDCLRGEEVSARCDVHEPL